MELTVGEVRALIALLPDDAIVYGFQEAYNGADDTVRFDRVSIDNGKLCIDLASIYEEDDELW